MSMNEPLMPVVPAGGPTYRPLGGWANAAVFMVAITCVTGVVRSVANWHSYNVVDGYLNGTGVTDADLDAVDGLATTLTPLLFAVAVATPLVFVVWMWRARCNAEVINQGAHRMARGWTIGGWICPIVNFWFPFRIMQDIWQVSRLAGVHASDRVLRWWWTAWVLHMITNVWYRIEVRTDLDTVDTAQEVMDLTHGVAVTSTFSSVFECLAGVFVIMIVRQITRWQSAPRQL